MQEETNEKTIALYIKTGKLTAQQLQKAMKALLAQMKKQHDRQKIPHGKQTLKQLMKQNAGVSNIEITKDNIEYDYLIQDRYLDRDRIEEILALILETVCTKRKTIRIAGDDYPAELVKARFMKLNSEHIRFVLDCMQENTTKIRNIKQYMKAALFNAPSTIGSYYTSLVSHDMADGTFYGKPKKSGIPDYTCNEGESL